MPAAAPPAASFFQLPRSHSMSERSFCEVGRLGSAKAPRVQQGGKRSQTRCFVCPFFSDVTEVNAKTWLFRF